MKKLNLPFKLLPGLFIILTASIVFSQSNAIDIQHLQGDFYIYTTYQNLNGIPYPSNSMYLITTEGVVLIDTPWDSTQFQPLLDSIERRHHLPVVLCLSTHFHADRTAGLAYYGSRNIATFTSFKTFQYCKERNEKQSTYYFVNDTVFNIGNHSFKTFYPGAGHSPDNIVVWFEKEKILYGGCFVKSTEVNSLGNLEDADINAWLKSIDQVIKKYREADIIIPGHYGWENDNSLKHTRHLLRKAIKSE